MTQPSAKVKQPGDLSRTVNVRVSDRLWRSLRKLAIDRDSSLTEEVNAALEQYVSDPKQQATNAA